MTATLNVPEVLANRRSLLDQRVGRRNALRQHRDELTELIAELTATVELEQQAAALLNSIGDERQDRVRTQIEGIVTHGLQLIFGGELSFHLVTATRANATTVDFIVRTTFADGETLDTPVMDARGGGVASVVGFLLRLTVLLLTPGARRLMLLDESFAQVSAEYEPRIAEFLRAIVDQTGIQIVMVTHSDAYSDAADTVYRFALDDDGRTAVRAETSGR